MNFFKIKTSWSNLDLAFLKICAGTAYLILGVFFHQILKPYLPVIGIIFIITLVRTSLVWLRGMALLK